MMGKVDNRIGIVILNYNTYEDTIRLVQELQNQTIAAHQKVVIVDNCSPNASFKNLKPLENEFPNVVVLQTDENLGYAKGNNFGLNYLEENIKPHYIAILNNDIILNDNCFEILVKHYTELNNPAIIAPLMKTPDRKIRLPNRLNNFAEDCLSMFICLNKFYKGNKYSEIVDEGNRAMQVDLIPGSFMFSSADVFKSIGYFNPGTFLYGEEAFIAYKVKEANLNNYILLDIDYIHAHRSPTISKSYNTASKYKLLFDSMLLYTKLYRKHTIFKCVCFYFVKPFCLLEKYIYDFFCKIK